MPTTPPDGSPRMRRAVLALVAVLVVLRIATTALLVLGPWFSTPTDLKGWDVERFQQIVDDPGRPYVDRDVEYPPGFVLVIEAVAGPSSPDTHDRLAVLALVTDLVVAGLVVVGWGRRAGVAYLVLGTVLLPFAYVRLDLLAVALAVGALVADRRRRPVLAGVLVALGFLVKTWPVVLVAVLVAKRSWRAAIVAGAATAVGLLAWVAYAGVDGPRQVLSFRGATGWHVESLVGALVALAGGGPAVLQQGAYRLGTAWAPVRLALLALTAAVLGLVAWRPLRRPDDDALAAVAAVTGLLVLSALLSPQYLLWTLPFVAVVAAQRRWRVAGPAVAACLLTTLTVSAFGPPGLDTGIAPWLMTARNLLLVATVVAALVELRRPVPPEPDPSAPSPASTTGR